MQRKIIGVCVSLILGFLGLCYADSIEPYNKERDHAFIAALVTSLPQEFPEADLITDLDSEIIHVYWPDKDGKPTFHVSYKQVTFMYCIDQKPVGFIRLFDALDTSPEIIKFRTELVASVVKTDRVSMIEQLAVLPEHQRKGIAEKLVKYVIQDRKKEGFGAIVLTTMSDNFVSQKLYEKLRFIMVREERESVWGCYKWYVYNTSLCNN